jgi:AcrR family transcriptional regulator
VPTPSGPPTTAPVGRPRSGGRQRPGHTPREEILDAAAELFTSRGYAATSTRMIADAVGVRQASLYYHFASKEELLEELLAGTVRPSLTFAEELKADLDRPADARLFALAWFDTGVLCGGRWNLGALYLLPEVRGDRFENFRRERAQLRTAYAELIQAVLDRTDDATRAAADSSAATATGPTEDTAEDLADLVFGLVESVITIRSEREVVDVPAMAQRVASGGLRLVGLRPARIAELAAALVGSVVTSSG